MKMKKFISALIACAMLFTTMGISAFAAEAETATYVAKIGETGYPSLSAALNGVKANETITVSAGEYSDFYTADDGTTYNYLNSTADLCELPDGVTITAAEGAEVLITNAPHLKAHDFTVEGIDFKGSNLAFQVTGCGTFENCDIYGGNGTYASINNCKDKDLSFINCKVSGDVYGLQVTEGSGNVVINGCEVIGWCSYGVSGSLTIIDSKYYTSDRGYGKLRMYQNATITNTAFGDDVSIDTRSSGLSITFTSCSVVDSTTGQVSSKPLAALIAEDTINDSSVTVDGTVVTEAVEDLVIDNISELSAFANQVNGGNTYEGKTITLNADIDASSLPVTIGTKENPFMGTFDGQGHKISNLSITKYDQGKFYGDYVGLFGVINSPAVVKNVTVENPFIVGRSCVGGIVGSAYTGTVENCHVTGEIDIEGYYKVGGITGDGYAKIINCSVAGAEDWDYSIIKATYSAENYEGDNVGGIIGFKAEGSIDISNCSVKNVTVSGTRKVGGVVGSAVQNNNITGCTVENVTVTTNATEGYASANAGSMGIGGIVGLTSQTYTGGSIADCTVSNLTLKVENELTTYVSAGAITGGHRGTNAPVEPADTLISGNSVNLATVKGANNEYLLTYVAAIGDVKYTDLQSAIDAAAAGETITLLADVTLSDGLKVAADDVIILDLAGYTISQTKAQTAGYQMILNDGSLTINDSVGGGKISYTDSGNGGEYISDTIYNRGTLVINGGTIENLSSATVATNGYPHAVDTYSGIRDTSVTINGGTIYCAAYSAIRMFCVSATYKADLVIKGGTINGAVDMQNGTSKAALGSLTITDGTFETTANVNNIRFANWNSGASEYGITASIKGGTFDGDITTTYVPTAANWDNGIISGGTFSKDVSAYLADGYELAENADGTYSVCKLPDAEKKLETRVLEIVENAQYVDGFYRLTLFAGIDRTDYDEVGFEFTIDGGNAAKYTIANPKFYDKLNIYQKGELYGGKAFTGADLERKEGNAFCSYLFGGGVDIDQKYDNTLIKYRPFAVKGEETIYGYEVELDDICTFTTAEEE